jgi:hypothetical protein
MPTSPAQIVNGAGTLTMGDEPHGLAVNPAGLAAVKWRTITTSGVQWFDGVYGGSVSAALPLKTHGTVGVALGYWTLGSIASYDGLGAPLGNISPQAFTGTLDYGYELFGGFSAGAGVKFTNLIMPQRTDVGVAFDLGAEYRWQFLAANLQVRDLGPKNPVNGTIRDKLPAVFTSGVRAGLWKERVVMGLQLNARTGERPYPILGLQVTPLAPVTLSLSASGEKDKDKMSRYGAGLTVHTTGKQDYAIEYGYRSYGDLGYAQALSLGINF